MTLKQHIEQCTFPVKHEELSFSALTFTQIITFPETFFLLEAGAEVR